MWACKQERKRDKSPECNSIKAKVSHWQMKMGDIIYSWDYVKQPGFALCTFTPFGKNDRAKSSSWRAVINKDGRSHRRSAGQAAGMLLMLIHVYPQPQAAPSLLFPTLPFSALALQREELWETASWEAWQRALTLILSRGGSSLSLFSTCFLDLFLSPPEQTNICPHY